MENPTDKDLLMLIQPHFYHVWKVEPHRQLLVEVVWRSSRVISINLLTYCLSNAVKANNSPYADDRWHCSNLKGIQGKKAWTDSSAEMATDFFTLETDVWTI